MMMMMMMIIIIIIITKRDLDTVSRFCTA